MGLIYLATNLQSGKAYIGLTTKTLQWRKDKHYTTAKHNRKKGKRETYFHSALLKYDESMWQWMVLQDGIPNALLSDAEIKWIAFYKSIGATLYNGTDGGEGGNGSLGYSHTADAKLKMSLAHAGIGHKLDEETKRKIGVANKGRIPPVTTILNAVVANQRTGLFISPTGEIVEVTNFRAFAKEHGLTAVHLSNVINGKTKHHKGWRKA